MTVEAAMFTVGPVQENAYVVRLPGDSAAVMVDPGEEAPRLLAALRELEISQLEAILLTHTHFDHIGAVAEVARATGAPVYVPEREIEMLRDPNAYMRLPGFGPFEGYEADQRVGGGETLDLAGMSFDVQFVPGHSIGHVSYGLAEHGALFSGDVLFQGSVGRVDLPGGDWPTLEASIGRLLDAYPDEMVVHPGHMGLTTLGDERAANPVLREPAHHSQPPPPPTTPDSTSRPPMSSIQAPRGTFDVLPADAERRAVLEGHAERVLGGAGYGRIETPVFEATELFSRGVGVATDIVQKEMYTFADDGGRSLTLRPEGTAPVCRAYLEHGMHKLPQPVKLWYLEPFFRTEAPQRGRYRQFWQVGAEVIGAAGPETDAELIILLADIYEAIGARDVRLSVSSLGTPETRVQYREELTAFLRAHEDGLSPDVVARIDLNPMRAFDASDERTRATMAGAPLLLDRLAPEDGEHFAHVRELLDDAGVAYDLDPALVRGLDYYTRTVFEFSSEALGAQSGIGGGGRYDGLMEQIGGPATPASGWASGVERILLAAGEVPTAPRPTDLFVALAGREPAVARAGFEITTEARHAGLAARMELAGRSLKGQLKHADRIGARYVAIISDAPLASLKDMESGEQTELERSAVIAAVLRGERL